MIRALRARAHHHAVVGLVGLLFAAAIAEGAAATPRAQLKRDVRTVQLRAGHVTTVDLPYPDALEFAGARYSGSVRLLPPPARETGRRPSLQLITILSRGPAEGGSLFRVRIRNENPPGTLPARALLTAITRVPAAG